jgi:cell division protein ZapE
MQATPLSQYEELVSAGRILPDPDQHGAARALDALWHELAAGKSPSIWQRFTQSRPDAIKGLYIWGGVGRGKTWLMDLFFESLPGTAKKRIHFHRFMQSIHHGLKRMDNVQDPLAAVAEYWARNCRVLCLDEFFVSDIADAMLLSSLLQNLFARGVTLVITSNLPPDALYRDGLQRARFLPAIERLKQHTRVLHLEGVTDFRLRFLEQSEIYHWPVDQHARDSMNSNFEHMAAGCELDNAMELNERPFQAVRRGDGVIWFQFDELCRKPRGSEDFIEIARSFNTVMLSDLPQLQDDDANAARRFITLVDEFYDRGVKLLLTAQTPLERLYAGKRLAFEFERTISRLTEMQTHAYLARPHLP